MKEIVVKIGKEIHPDRLKGATLEEMKMNEKVLSDSADKLKPIKGGLSKCWVCNSTISRDIASVYGIKFVQCLKCSHVYRKYLISEQAVYDFFETDEDINCHLNKGQFEYRYKFVSKPKVDAVMQARKKLGYGKKGRWLDAACGGGDLLYYIKNRYGWDVFGFDINDQGIKVAKSRGINVCQADIFKYYEQIYKDDGRFDVISFNGFLDLAVNPLRHLQIAKKMLKPDGMVMINNPKANSITTELIKLLPEHAIRQATVATRSIFTDKSMKLLLKKAGFKVVFDWRFGLDFYTYLSMMAMINPKLAQSSVHKFFINHYNEFQKIIDRNNCSDFMFYIAQKSRV